MAALVENKKIRLDYEIMETYEAGIELLGFEVKSLRARTGSLLGSYVVIRGDEAFLIHAHIPAYQEANTPPSYDPYRNRRLLLKKKEIQAIAMTTGTKNGKSGAGGKGLTIAPISVYSKDSGKTGGKIKIEIAIVRGKKKYDKRQDLKKRASERDIAREFAR
jgi:SsrA-binding protein